MIETFRSKNFNKKSLILLDYILEIIEEYSNQNIKLTLRQLYYQLVSRDYIINKQSEYSKLSKLVTDARYCGIIDWDAIEDRIRMPRIHSEFENIIDLIRCAKASYRLDRWKEQKYYIELFTEKDALTSILLPIANKWHIHFNVNRGYSSATATYDTSKRFLNASENGKELILLYLGDHDPSGLDMVRDIRERLLEFGVPIEVEHIALTSEQIKKYNPPPNPAKFSDPRAKMYISKYGKTSWEVDALKPEVMIKLVNQSIEQYVDIDLMQEIVTKEKSDIKKLEKYVEKL